MKKNFKNTAGVTLVEIVIVLAVVSIMSVMVVTFSMMCSGWTSRGIGRKDMLVGFASTERGIRNFCSKYDLEGNQVRVSADELTVWQAQEGEQPEDGAVTYDLFYIKFDAENEKLLVIENAEQKIAYDAENIKAVTFTMINEKLLKVTVDYEIPAANENGEPLTGQFEIAVSLRAAKFRGAA